MAKQRNMGGFREESEHQGPRPLKYTARRQQCAAAEAVAAKSDASQPSATRRQFGGQVAVGLVCAVGLAGLLVGLAAVLHGKVGVEKTLTGLTFPVQAGWLVFSGWVAAGLLRAASGRSRWRQSGVPLLLWGGFTLAGSPLLGDAGIHYLETRETAYDPHRDPPLDLLIVLGGGTSQGPQRAEVDKSGDRVVWAAELFLQGHVKRLITTGSSIRRPDGRDTTAAQQTCEIWTALGIPSHAIETLPGANTFAEMQSLRQRMDEQPSTPQPTTPQPTIQSGVSEAEGPLRVGLLTSAWHLPRAMRLARAAGLPDVVPVAADHMRRGEPPALWDYLPSADNLLRLETCQREFMAAWVGR